MKLRIRGDSLRLRLTRTEVDALRETGRVSETIHFGPRALDYVLCSADVDAPEARFVDDRIEVALPRATARAWAEGDEVGIESEQGAEQGPLRLLIEKDYRCLTPREGGAGEDDDDAFPHPGAESGASC